MGQNPLAFFSLNAKSNAAAPAYTGQQGELFVGQRHGLAYEPAYAQAMFFGANQSGVTTTVGLATTYVGLCLSNPNASKKNLAIQRVSGFISVAPATNILGAFLAVGNNVADVTHTTPVTPASTFIGGSATPSGLLDSSATLPSAPVYARPLQGGTTATSAFAFTEAVNGEIILPPGAFAIIATNVAGPASGFWGSFTWEEVNP